MSDFDYEKPKRNIINGDDEEMLSLSQWNIHKKQGMNNMLKNKIKPPKKSLGFFAVLAVFTMAAWGSFYQTDEGERTVILRNGSLIRIDEPGLGFKVPFLDSSRTISLRDQNAALTLEAYSYDQQPATLQVSVTFKALEGLVKNLYSDYGSLRVFQERVIERRTPDAVKNVFGKFTAVRAIQEREKLSAEIFKAISAAMEGTPVHIASVQVEEVGFSQAYEQSIEKRMLAQVQIETTRQQKQTAEVQAEIKVIEAKAEADAQRQRFEAEADGIKLKGEAEAAAIEARAKALENNTRIVELMATEKWDGKLPATQVPGSALPFIGVK